MMCFNLKFIDWCFKMGCQPRGIGIHHKTKKTYVYFEETEEFLDLLNKWNDK